MANLFDQANERKKWDATIAQVGQMGYPQNPAQPPAFTSPQPRRPTSFGDAAAATNNPGVTQLPNSPAQPASTSGGLNAPWWSGEYATAARLSDKSGLELEQQRAAAATPGQAPANDPVKRIINTGTLAMPQAMTKPADVAPAAPAAPNPSSVTPSATATTTAEDSIAGAGRGSVNPPLANPSAPAPSAQPEAKTGSEIMPGVYNHGRGQYSDNAQGMNMPAEFTGRPNPQNMAAAANLAASQQAPTGRSMAEAALSQPYGVQAPVVRNSTNDWAARNNLRNMQVSASSITNTPEWSRGATTNWRGQQVRGQADQDGNVAAYQDALKSDLALQQAQPGMDQAAMRENAGIQREGMQQQGATTRTGMQERGSMGRTMAQAALEQQKINQAGESQGFANRAAGRLEALQTAYQTAKTPEERSTLDQQIRGIQGRNDPAEWGVQVTPTTKNIDGSTSMGSIVRYNKATGQTEVVQQPGQGGGAQPSANHLAALKANPKQAAQFDEVYGPGAAARALKGG